MEGLYVKFAGGVDHPGGAHGVYLQLRVVGGSRHPAAVFAAEFDEADGQRCALRRVGARSQLVKQHQRLVVALIYDLDNVFHMGGEGGQALLDALLVADVRQHLGENGNGAAVVGGNVQAALGHKGQKPDGLQSDGLAAGVGAGDDQGIKVHAQPHGDGHDLFCVNEGMARLLQLQRPIGADDRLDGLHGKRQLRPGKNHVQPHQQGIVLPDGLQKRGGLGGQLRQNPLDLLLFPQQQLPQGVVGVDRGHGLDKKGGARGGHVVNQAGNFVFEFGLYRHHIAVAAHGDDGIAQVFGIGRRGNELLQGFFDFGALHPHMAANVRQLGAGAVSDFVLGQNGAVDFFLQIFVGRQSGEHPAKAAVPVAVAVVLDHAGAAQHAGDVEQLHRIEAAAPVGSVQTGAHVLHLLKARRSLEGNEAAGRRGLALQIFNVAGVRKGTQLPAALLSLLADGAVRQFFQHRVQFQLFQGFFVQFRHILSPSGQKK